MPYEQTLPKFSDANLRGEFFRMFAQTTQDSPLDVLSMKVKSDQAYETYGWLEAAPRMREWKGGRQLQTFTSREWTIYNKKFESTIPIPIDDIRRDKTGQLALLAAAMGKDAAENPFYLMTALMAAAEASICYDGQYFFDTDHSEGKSGTQSNIVTFDISDEGTGGTAAKPTVDTMEAAIDRGIEQFAALKDASGKYINKSAKNFVIVSGLGYRSAIRRATKLEIMANGRQNIITTGGDYTFKHYVDPGLGWTNQFAMFRADDPIKPFIHQVEVDTQITYITNPESDEVFNNDRYVWGAKRIEGLGFGDYKKAVLVKVQA